MPIGTTINGLNAVTSLTTNDEVPVWDKEASGEPTKKITAQNLASSVKSLAYLPNTTEMNAAIAQSTASKANNVTQNTSLRVITSGYNTGSGNYFDFFLPLNVDMSKTYTLTLSEAAIQYSNNKLQSYFGACTVYGKQANGLYCEISFTQTQTANIPGTLVCTAAISVT